MGGCVWCWSKVILLAILLTVMSVQDIREKQVSQRWLLGGGAGAALLAVCECLWYGREIGDCIWGIVPGVLLLAVCFLTGKVGSADGILVMIAGLCLGAKGAVLVLGISLLLSSCCSIFLVLLRKWKMSDTIPFVPYIGAACVGYLLLQWRMAL